MARAFRVWCEGAQLARSLRRAILPWRARELATAWRALWMHAVTCNHMLQVAEQVRRRCVKDAFDVWATAVSLRMIGCFVVTRWSQRAMLCALRRWSRVVGPRRAAMGVATRDPAPPSPSILNSARRAAMEEAEDVEEEEEERLRSMLPRD